MPKLNNDNWIYDDDNSSYAKKAADVLRKAKHMRAGKRFIHVVVSTMPLTIVEKEDPQGQLMYGKGHE